MELRPLEERDLEAVRVLRNASRRWFFYNEEISAEAQQAWFERIQHEPVRFWVMEEDGEVIGTVSLTHSDEGLVIGNLIVDEKHRGRGFAVQALDAVTSAPGRYVGYMMPGNEDSLRALKKSGFSDRYVLVEKLVDS